jgi:hypothetical protein
MPVRVLFKKVVLFAIVELAVSLFIGLAIPPDQESFVAAIEDKKSLLVNTNAPRVIFAGGSSLAFGFDSASAEAQLKMPVINFGVHASLGLETYLNLIERYVQRGDIIVIVPEYSVFNNGASSLYGSNDILADFVETDPTNIQYLAKSKWVELPLIGFNMVERKTERELTLLLVGSLDGIRGVYTRSSFNSYGDVIGHLDKSSLNPDDIPAKAVLQPGLALNANAFAMLEKFNQVIRSKGGVVIFDFPSVRMRNCENTGSERFNNLVLLLKTRTTIRVLSTPYDRCYPDNYFFDTAYHLNENGRLVRTQQMVSDLIDLLESGTLK